MNFKASKLLGNCKPPLLLQVELSLWRAVLDVATGVRTVYSAMKGFLEKEVPWSDLDQVSDRERDFFLPGGVPFLSSSTALV